ncbi:MAG: hypothetical protein WC829_11570 [Hyphomicrobium sp.]|jgi:hypothetical protein
MSPKAVALALTLLSAAAASLALGKTSAQGAVTAPAAVQELAGQNPPAYYRRADELFKEGKKDDAVFVLYLGQLHFRTYLLTHRDPDQSQAPAMFATLSQVIGKPITQYAFGDIPALARTIDAVLAYDAAHPDSVSAPTESADVHEDVRKGLAAMKVKMLSEAARIHAQREKSGLENR